MAAPKGGISIDWQAMDPNSPAAELEVVGSLSPPFTPHPPAAASAHADSDDGGGEVEFANFTDQELGSKIRFWEVELQRGLLRKTQDNGEKMRARVGRMKKEHERRSRIADRQKQDDTVRRQAVQAKSTCGNRGNVYDLNHDDEVLDSTAGRYYKKLSCASSTKTYTQVKGAAYKEGNSLSHGKYASPIMGAKKDGRIAKYSANHQLKTSARLPKHTDCELLNTDIDTREKSTLRSCTTNPQENNTVDSKGICTKFLEENATCGSNRRSNLTKNKASTFKCKKDVVLLDDDDDTEHVRSAADVKRDESKIYYPSRTDPEAVELTYSDMKCLEPEEYLKSPVINFCLQYLKKSRHRGDLYMFNTYFYSKLEEALRNTTSTLGDHDSQFSKLRRWWRNVDIFKKAYIILPIHEMMHWSLIIVCMPTKEGDSGPVMLHMDSLGLHNSQKLFDTVARYLEAEWRHLQKDSSYDIPFSGMIWKRLSRNIKGEKVEVPRQRNEYDCGLFMLHYIDKFIQEAPKRFTKESLGMFGRKWFNHEEASRLREGVRARLFDLFQSAEEDDGPSEPEWHPGDRSEEDKDADTVMDVTLESECQMNVTLPPVSSDMVIGEL
ncbi:ubiquitin-like-specific protease 1D isoform X2 [Panicum virgatum]|uniref:Ubiquitin-like protease family profile domain-containing protein n=1 Tax=Panicum virgatum TaxID=38727 RepID=A0A8T0S2N4_PANVG|nr:ubiquitin-like-specific protease 1D isoform X2 [Panicum virgatum]KAG2591505.1 hypothetical protein PVAP13_5NG485000 [Panicum virgatum]